MSGKVAKRLRRQAELETVGMPEAATRARYLQLKAEYKTTKEARR